jgi:hypothetical protein
MDRTLYLGLIIATMTFTLTALAMGLGALYPNFREDNPTKIVSGFGGTLCLVLSFLYIVGSVTLLALGSPWGWKGETSVRLDSDQLGRLCRDVHRSWAGFPTVWACAESLPLEL